MCVCVYINRVDFGGGLDCPVVEVRNTQTSQERSVCSVVRACVYVCVCVYTNRVDVGGGQDNW